MLQFELIAIFIALASFNLVIFIAICFSHKKKSIERINGLKGEWFISLPLRFMELADDIMEDRINEKEAPDELRNIISSYDALTDLEKAYIGKSSDNILSKLSLNFIFILMSAGLAVLATYSNDQQDVIMFSGLSLTLILYFFAVIGKVLIFIKTEEDNFQKIEKDIKSNFVE